MSVPSGKRRRPPWVERLALCVALGLSVPAAARAQGLIVTPTGTTTTSVGSSSALFFVTWQDTLNVEDTMSVTCTGVITACSFPGGQTKYGQELTGSDIVPIDFVAVGVNYTASSGGQGTITVTSKTTSPAFEASATLTVNVPKIFDVAVSVSPTWLPAQSGQGYTTTFKVKNSGNVSESLSFSGTCTGPAIQSCGSASPSSQNVGVGDSTNVTVSWTAATAAAAASGVTLTASDGASSSGTATQSVSEYAAGLDVADANPGISFNRASCLTVSVGEQAAFECGDLRLTHPLPSVRTYNKLRTPTLIYNWRFATPAPNLGALLTIAPIDSTLDSVSANLYVYAHGSSPGAAVASGSWKGTDWNSGSTQMTRRIQMLWGGYTDSSGMYDYSIATHRYYNGGGTMHQDSATGHFVFVNRYTSPFGAGWWLAGFERIFIYSDGLAWIGGDGSTAWYAKKVSTDSVFYPQTFTSTGYVQAYMSERDSIIYHGANASYTRYALHGTQILYNNLGEHLHTTDRLGHQTLFWINSTTRRVDSVTVPGTQDAKYSFTYTGGSGVADTALSKVVDPMGRTVTLGQTLEVSGATLSISSIKDPDNYTISFGFDPAGGGQTRITSRTDKRGNVTTYGYAMGAENLGISTLSMLEGTGRDITKSFSTPGKFGQAASFIPAASDSSVNPDSLWVLITGPRANAVLAGGPADSTDTTRVWIDQWWQPIRIHDAHGSETLIQRLNATFPTRVTSVTDPLGRVQAAVYESRGNDSLTIDYGAYQGGQYATTMSRFDGRWDFDTVATLPAGETVHDSLDSMGNRLWEQLGPTSTYRTLINYQTSCGLVSSIVRPATAKDSLLYDSPRCNLSDEQSPNGHWTVYTTDTIGRITQVTSPIEVGDVNISPGSYERLEVTHLYDIMDRDSVTTTIGPAVPALTHSTQQTLTVTRSFDPNGNLAWVNRAASPDSASIGILHIGAVFDRNNRQTVDTTVNGLIDWRTFDVAGNVDSLHTRRGFKIQYTYDALNRLVQEIVPSFTATAIDSGIPFENLGKGGTGICGACSSAHQDSSYDQGYTPYIERPYGGQLVHGDTVLFSYDADGRITVADNVNAHIGRQYNLSGWLMAETDSVRTVAALDSSGTFADHIYGMQYRYDIQGRRDTLYVPSQFSTASTTGVVGTIQTYSYNDTTGWLDTTVDATGGKFLFGYAARGDLTSITFPSVWSAQETFTYDNDANLLTDVVVKGDTTMRQDALSYDARDKLLNAADKYGIADTLWSAYNGLGYVAIDSSHNYATAGIKQTTIEHFAYDPFGNRLHDTTTSGIVVQQGGDAGGGTINFWTYADTLGWLTAQNDGPNFSTEAFHYDVAGNTHFEFDSLANLLGNEVTSTLHDRASFYTAEEQLAEADDRTINGPAVEQLFTFLRADEVYRYDALGRRVLVIASRTCGPYQGLKDWRPDDCRRSFVRRTVWDGNDVLAEVQVQDTTASIMEQDGGVVQLSQSTLMTETPPVDNNPFFGQVMYTHALGTDQPLNVIRLNYGDVELSSGTKQNYYLYPPLVIAPVWNSEGRWDLYFSARDTAGTLHDNACSKYQDTIRCPLITPEFGFAAYNNVPPGASAAWFGSLLQDKLDQTATFDRRARIYDPVTGRFTQPDPIGLAGGINDYGFAAGDPVNYSDPFGLCVPLPVCLLGPAIAGGEGGSLLGPVGTIAGLVGAATIAGLTAKDPGAAPNPGLRSASDVTSVSTPITGTGTLGSGILFEGDASKEPTAGEIISKEKKGSINRVFPGELRGHTLGEIEALAKAGNKTAQTAKKLLTDKRFNKPPTGSQ